MRETGVDRDSNLNTSVVVPDLRVYVILLQQVAQDRSTQRLSKAHRLGETRRQMIAML